MRNYISVNAKYYKMGEIDRISNHNFRQSKVDYLLPKEQIKFQNQKIAQIRKLEEKKRQEVVESRKEAAAIEKLKEKKIEQYNKDVKKKEEQFIEEFVSNSMSAVN